MRLYAMRCSGAASLAVACGLLLSDTRATAQTTNQTVDAFLPRSGATAAVYVEIERDPAYDDYARRIQAARAKDPGWFQQYAQKHPYKPGASGPYDEKFGVTREEYERFSHAMNQFREVKRQDIQIQRGESNGQVQLSFQGTSLLVTQLIVQVKEGVAQTPTDTLPSNGIVDVEIASLPPGAHRGMHYRTPDARIAATKRRESLVIGEVKGKELGIIHYSVNTPGQVRMAYVQWKLEVP